MTTTDLAYRRTAIESASGFGLLIALYDTLAGDMRRAAEAQRSNDIEKRCHEVNHALRVIGLLEDFVERGPGGELAQQLVAFYAFLRGRLIMAQAKQSAETLNQLMIRVLKIREAWQQADLGLTEPAQSTLPPVVMRGSDGYQSIQAGNSACSWSA